MSTKNYILDSDNTKELSWECIFRTDTGNFRKIYGAEVCALIKDQEDTHDMNDLTVLIIENYRYAVEQRVLEFPSGLIDPNEFGDLEVVHEKISSATDETVKASLQEEFDELLKQTAIRAAERELKEETGYHGQFKGFFALPRTNPVKLFSNVYSDPWKSLENGALCIFQVDKTLEQNKEPKQELDECENIKVHEVKISQLLNFITQKIEKENFGCSEHLYTFSVGLHFADILKDIKII